MRKVIYIPIWTIIDPEQRKRAMLYGDIYIPIWTIIDEYELEHVAKKE